MALRWVGFITTVVAVLVLIGSMLAGLGQGRDAPPPSLSASGILPDQGEPIGVEVLNGSGIAGAARAATDQLRALRFDVKLYGNAASSDRDSSVVLHRRGDPAAARSVAEALGIPRVETEIDTTLYLEATVILGKDWRPADP